MRTLFGLDNHCSTRSISCTNDINVEIYTVPSHCEKLSTFQS